MNSNLNPVWNQELMLSVPESYGPVKLVRAIYADGVLLLLISNYPCFTGFSVIAASVRL